MKAAKKTFMLPQKLIDQVKKTLQTKTETEAIIRAMQEVLLQEKLVTWHTQAKGKMHIQNLYGR